MVYFVFLELGLRKQGEKQAKKKELRINLFTLKSLQCFNKERPFLLLILFVSVASVRSRTQDLITARHMLSY